MTTGEGFEPPSHVSGATFAAFASFAIQLSYLEPTVRFKLTYEGFADLSLVSWVRRLIFIPPKYKKPSWIFHQEGFEIVLDEPQDTKLLPVFMSNKHNRERRLLRSLLFIILFPCFYYTI